MVFHPLRLDVMLGIFLVLEIIDIQCKPRQFRDELGENPCNICNGSPFQMVGVKITLELLIGESFLCYTLCFMLMKPCTIQHLWIYIPIYVHHPHHSTF